MGSPVNVIKTATSNQFLANANFQLVQRYGTSKANPGSFTGYIFDRWWTDVFAATISRITSGLPAGVEYAFRYAATSPSAGIHHAQPLESFLVDKLKGKTVTFSFYVKRNADYAANVKIQIQKNAVANSATGTWITVGETVYSNAQVPTSDWLLATVTVLVPNDGSANGLRVIYTHNGGTGSATAILDIHSPMLNLGETRLPWSLFSNNIVDEIAFCQRYFEKSYDLATTPGAVTGNGATQIVIAQQDTANEYRLSTKFSVRKRTSAPLMTIYNPSTGAANQIDSGATAVVVAVGESGFTSGKGPASGSSNSVYYHWVADAEL